jgi:hypothetical protein
MDSLARLITTLETLRDSCVGVASSIGGSKEFDDAITAHGDLKCRLHAAGPFAALVDDAVRLLIERGQDAARAQYECDRAGRLLTALFWWRPGGAELDGLYDQTDAALMELRRLAVLAGLPGPTAGGAVQESTAAPPATAEPQPAGNRDIEEYMKRLAVAFGHGDTPQLLAIMNQQDLGGEEKMIAIGNIDRRYRSRNSIWWGEVLNVNPAAVRQYKTWTEWKPYRSGGD